jgi:hypothetical protein
MEYVRFVMNAYDEFHENLANELVTDTIHT